ncbi:MAG: hypothetical protein JWR01_910, partial [Subtercola sp.]|nr:hypothetical protein [Subtercola sp.]
MRQGVRMPQNDHPFTVASALEAGVSTAR